MTGINGSGNGGELIEEEISIEERADAVVMWFGGRYAILRPEQAMGMGEILMRYSHHIMTGQEESGQRTLSAQIVRKLENTVAAAITEMKEQHKTPMYMAERVVNICLSETV
jgi:hypothetical protein